MYNCTLLCIFTRHFLFFGMQCYDQVLLAAECVKFMKCLVHSDSALCVHSVCLTSITSCSTQSTTQFTQKNRVLFSLLLRHSMEAKYCDHFICLSVCVYACVCLCVREHISGTAGRIFTKFVVQSPCGRGLFLLWKRCNTLCTSSFMDDVIFGHDVWLVALRHRGGV